MPILRREMPNEVLPSDWRSESYTMTNYPQRFEPLTLSESTMRALGLFPPKRSGIVQQLSDALAEIQEPGEYALSLGPAAYNELRRNFTGEHLYTRAGRTKIYLQPDIPSRAMEIRKDGEMVRHLIAEHV